MKCKTENEDAKEFCISCGNPLKANKKLVSNNEKKNNPEEGSSSGKLICPNCKLLYEKMTVCIRCGATLVKEIPSQQGEESSLSHTSQAGEKDSQTVPSDGIDLSTPRPDGVGLPSTQDFGRSLDSDVQTERLSQAAQVEELKTPQKGPFSPSFSDMELGNGEEVTKEKLRGAHSPEVKKEQTQVKTAKKTPSDYLLDDREKRIRSPKKRKKNFPLLPSKGFRILILVGIGVYLLWSLYSYLTTKQSRPSPPASKEATGGIVPNTSASLDPLSKSNSPVSEKVPDTISSSVPTTSKTSIGEREDEEEIKGLLEKIRQANLKKNIDLFMSCYCTDFKDREGKRRTTLESWGNFDYLDLSYNLKRRSISGDTAIATIEWLIKVSLKPGGQTQVTKSVLEVTFKREENGWKIREIKPVG
jgi:ketosteroid isomerase-like protein